MIKRWGDICTCEKKIVNLQMKNGHRMELKKACIFWVCILCCFLSAGAVDLKKCRIVVSENEVALVQKMSVVLS